MATRETKRDGGRWAGVAAYGERRTPRAAPGDGRKRKCPMDKTHAMQNGKRMKNGAMGGSRHQG